MSRDPLHRQIVEALEEKRFDPQDFERCMCDILKDLYPGLVSIPGGDDAGMDGAIADGNGEPYPLVCTTGRDVSRNLRENLESYKRKGRQRDKVVLATSQKLTPSSRRELEKRALERGFVLEQIFEQREIADRLYRRPEWCWDLLRLSGTPSALSKYPKTNRPLLEIDLIGRDADVEWLQTTTGDRLLVGEPGSGKTYLLRHLVRQGWGLFLNSTDETRIANAIREQQQSEIIIVVDDAHSDPTQLELLRHLREGIGQPFSIVAVSWKGDQERVAAALGSLETVKIRRLELLLRRDILEVIRQAGIDGPPDLLRVLADQAANKPGLAVTLASLCLRGDWRKVVEGEALRTTLMPFFEDLVGRESTYFLGALALGGNRGMSLEAVGDFLRLSRVKVRELAIGLAAGGVLSEAGEDALAVQPRDLRSALLRRVFFQGSAADQPYRPLLEQAPDFVSAVQAIVDTTRHGGCISSQDLRELVVRSGPIDVYPGFGSKRAIDVWRGFTALGEEEARWALEHYPGEPADLAPEALHRAPRAVIPRLLEQAARTEGPLHSQPSHPLRLLQDWLEEFSSNELLERRELTARLARIYLREGGERDVGLQALFLSLSPTRQELRKDPEGSRVIFRKGLLPLGQLREMERIWEEAREAIEVIDATIWQHLQDALWGWVYPNYAAQSKEVPEVFKETMHAFAARVLRDLIPFAGDSPGLIAGLLRLAHRMDLELPLEPDPVFELLYPAHEKALNDIGQRETAENAAVQDLAHRWTVECRPEEVAQKLAWYENEATRIAHRKWPPRAQLLCEAMARSAADPALWLGAFLDRKLPSDQVRPFLVAATKTASSCGKQQIERCLDLDAYAGTATSLVLEMDEPPPHLLERTLASVGRFPHLVETLCLRRQVSLNILRALLQHSEVAVSVAAAVGEWVSEPLGQIRDEIIAEWRDAISRSVELEDEGGLVATIWLGDILAGDPKLAFEWVRRSLNQLPVSSRIQDQDLLAKATAVLEDRHRLAILDDLESSPGVDDLLLRLVSGSRAVYRKLLTLDHFKDLHPVPLQGIPDSTWTELARLALEAGYEPRAVAASSFDGAHTLWGYGQGYWMQWDRAFAALEEDSDDDLREVARYGREEARERIAAANAEQRQGELSGR